MSLRSGSVYTALIYSLLTIASICFVFYTGRSQWLFNVHLISWLAVFPFTFFIVWYHRNHYNQGFISGKEAMQAGLKFILLVILILCVFQVIFFQTDFKDFKINFIKSQGPLKLKEAIQQGQIKASESDIPKIIEQDIAQVTIFAEITAILFKYIAYGLFSSFISAVFLKRNR